MNITLLLVKILLSCKLTIKTTKYLCGNLRLRNKLLTEIPNQ